MRKVDAAISALAVVALGGSFGTTSEGEESTVKIPETSTTRRHQDGWSFMTSNMTMVLWKRTFNTDAWGRNITACVSANTTYSDNATHFIMQTYTFYNTCATNWTTFPKNFTAYSFNDTSMGQLDFFNSTSPYGSSPLEYYVLYADEECLLTKLLHRSNDTVTACELFTRDNYTEDTQSECEIRFLCDCDPALQWLYNKTQCDLLNEPTSKEIPENC
ncbi:uncharacterized protein LOC144167262 [Haemaphysalis longicornis]